MIMTFFADLSQYANAQGALEAIPMVAVGWLDAAHDFPKAVPTEAILDGLWDLCSVAVRPSRGFHVCPFCADGTRVVSERRGLRFALGGGEIRLFARDGHAGFAAPNLIYHYVEVHHYQPPASFLEALATGPAPSSAEYGRLLSMVGETWTTNSLEETASRAFRFVKRDGVIEKEWIPSGKP